MNKLKNILKKQDFINIAIIFAMFFLSAIPLLIEGANIVCFILSVILWSLICVFFSFENVLCIAITLLIPEVFASNQFPISLTIMLIVIMTFVYLVKYIIDLIKKNEKLNWQIYIINLLLIVFGFLNFSKQNINALFIHVILLATIFVCFIYLKKVDLKKVLKYYLYGLSFSILIGFIFALIPATKSLSLFENQRFMALCSNPNQLQVLCVIALSFLIASFFEYKIKLVQFITFALIIVTAGVFTLSKAFIISLFILLIITLILLLKRYKEYKTKIIMITLAFLAVFVLLFHNKIIEIAYRFFGDCSDSFVDLIFTGRVSIWKEYLDVWSSSALNIFFGCGITATQVVEIGTHSVYIDLIYRFGIFGILLIITACVLYLSEFKSKFKKIKFNKLIPIILILLLFAEENILALKYILLIVMSIYLVFNNDEKKELIRNEKVDMKEKISVIVPVYNVENYLEKCVNSILNQTYRNLEIILVDDGSPDKCPKICDKLAKKDGRIKVIHKKNGGVSSARNAGLDIATGDYIYFCDSDDYLEENALENLKLALLDSDWAFGGYYIVRQDNREKKIFNFENDNLSTILSSIIHTWDFGLLWNKLYKKDLIKSKFNENYEIREDLLFNINYLNNANSISVVNEPLYNYVKRDNSLTSSKKVIPFEQLKETHKLMVDCINNKSLNNVLEHQNAVFLKSLINLFKAYLGEKLTKEKIVEINNYLDDEDIKTAILNYKAINLQEKFFIWLIKKRRIKLILFIINLKY